MRSVLLAATASVLAAPGCGGSKASGDSGDSSGLPWRSGAATSDIVAFETWRGRPFDVLVGGSKWSTWADIEAPYVGSFDRLPGFLQVRMPMFPGSGASPASGITFADCAAGAYDPHFVALGNYLVAKGRGDSRVRLGWEANGNWYPWHAGNASSPNEWVQCFQHEATALRSAAPHVVIEWNMNADTKTPASRNPTDIYPGDSYVDTVGVDFYDFWPALTSDALWNQHYLDQAAGGGPHGIGAWLAYAQSRGKLLSIPEWGIVNSTKPDCGCGGDDPVYVGHMHDFFVANAPLLAYEAYFNLPVTAGDTTYLVYPPTTSPSAAARYMALF